MVDTVEFLNQSWWRDERDNNMDTMTKRLTSWSWSWTSNPWFWTLILGLETVLRQFLSAKTVARLFRGKTPSRDWTSITECDVLHVVYAGWQFSLSVGLYWAEAARYMSDSLLLPLSVTSYASALRTLILQLENGYGRLITQNGISLGLGCKLLHRRRLWVWDTGTKFKWTMRADQ